LQADHTFLAAAVPSDLQELIEAAASSIDGYRTDGPELGFFFDDPPMAAGVCAPSSKLKMIVFDGCIAEADEMGVRRHDLSEPEVSATDLWIHVSRLPKLHCFLPYTSLFVLFPQHTDERFSKFERERAREEAKRLKEAEKARLVQEREQKKLDLQKEKERKAEEKKKAIEDKKR
jgi:hypothetical protein